MNYYNSYQNSIIFRNSFLLKLFNGKLPTLETRLKVIFSAVFDNVLFYGTFYVCIFHKICYIYFCVAAAGLFCCQSHGGSVVTASVEKRNFVQYCHMFMPALKIARICSVPTSDIVLTALSFCIIYLYFYYIFLKSLGCLIVDLFWQ